VIWRAWLGCDSIGYFIDIPLWILDKPAKQVIITYFLSLRLTIARVLPWPIQTMNYQARQDKENSQATACKGGQLHPKLVFYLE
jgi:hypothetical protein